MPATCATATNFRESRKGTTGQKGTAFTALAVLLRKKRTLAMGRKAIVLGASSGMGRLVAIQLLRDGWTVGVAARRTDALKTIDAGNGNKPVIAQIDITNDDAAHRLHDLIERLGGIDLYFHSSGVGKVNPLLEPETELQTVATNALGFTRMVGEAFRWMASHGGGHIAVISSIAGVKGLGPAPSYSATKAFDNTYIQALEQLANSRHLDIRFTDIRPGFVDTALISGSHFPMTMRPEFVARHIVKAVYNRRHIVVIDWRWRILVALWRLVPNFIWRHLTLISPPKCH